MATQIYQATMGQSLFDVCLNTYGSLDFLSRLIQDNGVDSVDVIPRTGQIFSYDPNLVVDQTVTRKVTPGNAIYSTWYDSKFIPRIFGDFSSDFSPDINIL